MIGTEKKKSVPRQIRQIPTDPNQKEAAMPRGDKAKAEFLAQMRELTKTAGSVEEALTVIEREAIKDGIVKPSLDNDPEAKKIAEKLLEWCKTTHRRVVISPINGIKLSAVRKPRKGGGEEEEEEEEEKGEAAEKDTKKK